MILEAIKGYSTNEDVVFLTGDHVILINTEEEVVYIEGILGWCKGREMSLSPKVIADHFKFLEQ